MTLPWVEILVFPGFLFILGIVLVIEHINSGLQSLFLFKEKNSPMFIPIKEHFLLCFKGEKELFNTKTILQGIIVVIMLAISLFSSLLLPISIFGDLPGRVGFYGNNPTAYSGTVGVISFEGDLLLFLILLVLFGLGVFLIYWIDGKLSNAESLQIALSFMLFDIPIFIAFAGPAFVKKTLNIGIIAEDVKNIVQYNVGYSIFILIPIGLIVSTLALTAKFDRPFFSGLDNTTLDKNEKPLPDNWKRHILDISMRIMEFVIAGMIVSVFLGGSYFPIPAYSSWGDFGQAINFTLKTILVLLICTIVKALVPSLKSNQALNLSLKILTPIGIIALLLNVIYISTTNLN